jgi:alpha-ribazole phosphatase
MIADLLRHGSTGRDGHLDGLTDHGMSAAGWAAVRAQTAGRHWPLIVASPRRRTREPAAALAGERAVPLRLDDDWAELDFGRWDGRARAGIEAEPGGGAALAAFYADPAAHTPPGGEPWEAFAARIGRALRTLLAVEGPVLVVTHAGPIRLALAMACGFPFDRLWALRIAPATRVRLAVEEAPGGGLAGQIVEIAQP